MYISKRHIVFYSPVRDQLQIRGVFAEGLASRGELGALGEVLAQDPHVAELSQHPHQLRETVRAYMNCYFVAIYYIFLVTVSVFIVITILILIIIIMIIIIILSFLLLSLLLFFEVRFLLLLQLWFNITVHDG